MKHVIEFYGATEGNANIGKIQSKQYFIFEKKTPFIIIYKIKYNCYLKFIANTDGTPGAIGFVSRIIPSVYPIAIIKVDQETGEPVRDSRGLCQVAYNIYYVLFVILRKFSN